MWPFSIQTASQSVSVGEGWRISKTSANPPIMSSPRMLPSAPRRSPRSRIHTRGNMSCMSSEYSVKKSPIPSRWPKRKLGPGWNNGEAMQTRDRPTNSGRYKRANRQHLQPRVYHALDSIGDFLMTWSADVQVIAHGKHGKSFQFYRPLSSPMPGYKRAETFS